VTVQEAEEGPVDVQRVGSAESGAGEQREDIFERAQGAAGAERKRGGQCWYLVAIDDQAIPPAAERQFASRMGATTIEAPSGHLAMVSHPDEVAHLIETAAKAVQPGD
jgi:hypothetical protein